MASLGMAFCALGLFGMCRVDADTSLWAIGGLHDRPFQERSVFGQIRYMSHAGCKRKFDVDQYVQAWTGA